MGKYLNRYGKHLPYEIVGQNTFNNIELEIQQLEVKFSCLFKIMINNGLIESEQQFQDMINSELLMNSLQENGRDE